MAGIGELFFGTSDKQGQMNRFNPQQMQQQAAAGQLGLQGLQNTSMDFDKVRPRIMREFQTQTIPGLLERLQGMGGEGGLRSGGLGEQLGGAFENLGENLYGQEQQFNLQKFQNLLQAFQQGQQSPWDNYYQPGSPGLLHFLAGGAGQALPGLMSGASGNIGPALKSLLSMFGGNQTQTSAGPADSLMQQSTTQPGFAQAQPGFNAKGLYQAAGQFPGYMQPRSPSWANRLASGLVGAGTGFAMGGPVGALAGGGAGLIRG
jgi:hypothetical protein